MSEISSLWLYGNQLSGTIPSSIGNCTKLVELYLNDNQFVGDLPESLNNLEELMNLEEDKKRWMDVIGWNFIVHNKIEVKPGSPYTCQLDPGVKLHVSQLKFYAIFATGVTPFVVAGIEFSKRIVAQRKCGVCGGSGLVLRDKYYFRCPGCGGFLPWQSWKRFFSG
ncbi:Receptor-like protein kinase [Camellia lanceoleosa]|uniref:Receptor-like protein kinase n=1 Tax=Camellia lanceoleosa TaxID=1840588 RepID=A0ACC0H733_9ERIC|nr:Receptor-like protein kinase [Camellia lanceoleosa]